MTDKPSNADKRLRGLAEESIKLRKNTPYSAARIATDTVYANAVSPEAIIELLNRLAAAKARREVLIACPFCSNTHTHILEQGDGQP